MHEKTFVIDTNVLIHDPQAILKFPGQKVVIPVTVLEELDRMKRLRDELGRSSRAAIRLLDKLKDSDEGDLHEGLRIENDTMLHIQVEVKPSHAMGLEWSNNDNKIILTSFALKEAGERVVLVSKKFASRVKAKAIGLESDDYRNLRASFEAMQKGVLEIDLGKGEIDKLYKDNHVSLPKEHEGKLRANTCCLVKGEDSFVHARYDIKKNELVRLDELPKDIWGLTPLNDEQRCALDLLLNDDIKLVTLLGPAGTGKTLLALASALKKVFDDSTYNKILVSRPIMPLGKDIGFLPGTKEEKLYHWMQPIHDNLAFLCESTGNEPTDTLRWIVDSPKLEMEAVTYIRGRTLPKTYMIVDEAQNLTPHEVKTIVSRAGYGSKVVLTGDPSQIDNPYLDKDSNGLTYTWSRMGDFSLFGHIYLEKTERSDLAALAADAM